MRELVKLYVKEYGIEQALDEIATGFYNADLFEVATELYRLRNNFRKMTLDRQTS